jgi:hypothetical protein
MSKHPVKQIILASRPNGLPTPENRICRMKTSIAVSALIVLTQVQTVSPSARSVAAGVSGASAAASNGKSCAADANCVAEPGLLARASEIPVEKNAPAIPGHPLTSVVVTQCNLIVAVYVTTSNGKLLRFDKSSSIPASRLLAMAYTATRSERVEVSCNDVGSVGHESHGPP